MSEKEEGDSSASEVSLYEQHLELQNKQTNDKINMKSQHDNIDQPKYAVSQQQSVSNYSIDRIDIEHSKQKEYINFSAYVTAGYTITTATSATATLHQHQHQITLLEIP